MLLKAYHAWGADFVHRLNGMFAFAIWERDSGRVLLGRDRLGIKPLYNVGFEDVGGEKGNEFEYADIVARRFGTIHERIFVPESELLARLPEAVSAMNEPMVSHDCIGFYLLSEAVSRHSKVVQSGQGADEVFGGYHWYPKLDGSTQPVADYLAAFRDRDFDEDTRVVSPEWLAGDESAAFVAERFNAPGADDPVDKALRLDTTVMLVDDPVKRVDSMTMAFGLEARVPFVDHELVELAARIPARHKLAHVVFSARTMSTPCSQTRARTSRRCAGPNCGNSGCSSGGCRRTSGRDDDTRAWQWCPSCAD